MLRSIINLLAILPLLFSAPSVAAPVHIEENNKNITIRVKNAPLGEVLQSIEDKTGIQFHVSPSVRDDLIEVNLNAPDWQTAVKLLLDSYSRAELWNPRLDMTEIYILSRADGSGSFPSQGQQNPAALESWTGSPPMLSREQFLKLVSGSYRAPLSPELFDDPEIRSFFKPERHQIPGGHEGYPKSQKCPNQGP